MRCPSGTGSCYARPPTSLPLGGALCCLGGCSQAHQALKKRFKSLNVPRGLSAIPSGNDPQLRRRSLGRFWRPSSTCSGAPPPRRCSLPRASRTSARARPGGGSRRESWELGASVWGLPAACASELCRALVHWCCGYRHGTSPRISKQAGTWPGHAAAIITFSVALLSRGQRAWWGEVRGRSSSCWQGESRCCSREASQ